MSRIRLLLIWFGAIFTAVTFISLLYWDGTAVEVARIESAHRTMDPWWHWVTRVRASDGLFLLITTLGLMIALRWAPRGPGDRLNGSLQRLLQSGVWEESPNAAESLDERDDSRSEADRPTH